MRLILIDMPPPQGLAAMEKGHRVKANAISGRARECTWTLWLTLVCSTVVVTTWAWALTEAHGRPGAAGSGVGGAGSAGASSVDAARGAGGAVGDAAAVERGSGGAGDAAAVGGGSGEGGVAEVLAWRTSAGSGRMPPVGERRLSSGPEAYWWAGASEGERWAKVGAMGGGTARCDRKEGSGDE